MIDRILDEYELKARTAPALILALPVIVGFVYVAPSSGSWPIFAGGGICCAVLLYGLGYFVRSRGAGIEPSLWQEWGGAPSTRLLRCRDTTLAVATKARVRAALEKKLSIRLLAPEEERREPGRADRVISEGFTRVREYLRQHNPGGLWFKYNTEYGFSRNVLACRVLLVCMSVVSLALTAAWGRRTGAGIINLASSFELSFAICAIYYGWRLLPGSTKRLADAYAEAAWISFLELSEEAEGAGCVSIENSGTSV